jgi:hypothetical protein
MIGGSTISDILADLRAGQQQVLREQAKVRWWYVVGLWVQKQQWGGWAGPIQATDSQLYKMIVDQEKANPGLTHYRLTYSPLQKVWIWDLRSMASLESSSSPIPGYDSDSPLVSGRPPQTPPPFGAPKGAVGGSYDWWWWNFGRPAGLPYAPPTRIGVTQINPPLTGRWPFVGFPPRVDMLGNSFHLAKWKWPKAGIAAQYREARPTNSRHLYVMKNGDYVVSHSDEVNPDMSSPADHFIRDVMKRPAAASPLEAELRRKAPEI